MSTIKIEPTWQGILPALIAALQNGSFEGKRIATEELVKMARAADITVAAEKEKQLQWAADNYPPKWERPVLLALVKAILKRGHTISIYLEDEPMIEFSSDLEEVIKNLAAGDQDSLIIDGHGCFWLIYNNGSQDDPMTVISDRTANALCLAIYNEVKEEVES